MYMLQLKTILHSGCIVHCIQRSKLEHMREGLMSEECLSIEKLANNKYYYNTHYTHIDSTKKFKFQQIYSSKGL